MKKKCLWLKIMAVFFRVVNILPLDSVVIYNTYQQMEKESYPIFLTRPDSRLISFPWGTTVPWLPKRTPMRSYALRA